LVSDHLWGVVTNGKVAVLLRKTPFVRRQAHLEVDLEALITGEDAQAEFGLFFRLFHRSRLPQDAAHGHECPLERYYQETLSQGERAKEKLRDGVEAFLEEAGTGFLRGSLGGELLSDPQAFHGELLRLAYRLLFLLVAEARGVLEGNEAYRQGYSLERLARLVDDRAEAQSEDKDLWLGLKTLFHLLRDPGPLPGTEGGQPIGALGLHVLNGRLFERQLLEDDGYSIPNRDLLRAFKNLVYYQDPEDNTLRKVNYAALDVEELGSVYESLLENHPVIREEAGEKVFGFLQGTERRSTGSYYTPTIWWS
jgi:hypothetical protein